MANRIQLRRDTQANWERVNPILEDGEPGLDITQNKIKYGDGSSTWTELAYASGESTGSSGNTLVNGEYVISLGADGVVTLPNGMTIDSYGTSGANAVVTIGGDNTQISIDNDGAPPGFSVTTDAANAAHTWRFGSDGDLSFPNGSTIGSSNGLSGIPMTTERGTILFGNNPGDVITLASHFHIMKADSANVDLFFGDDYNYVKLPSTQGVEVGANGSIWTFSNTGTTTFPGNVTIGSGYGNISQIDTIFANNYAYANGVSILSTIVGITSINASVSTSTINDASGDFSYGSLSYDYDVNGVTAGGFTINYSAPLVHGNVDVNVGNVIASNVTTTNGIFWANGVSILSGLGGGGTTYSNTNVAAYLTTANITTTGNITAAWLSGNISITGNVVGTSPNVTIQAGSYSSTFNNQGNVTLPNLAVSGNVISGGYFLGNGALLTGLNTLYLLEAYASVTYTLPGSFTEDPCRYSVVSSNVNVSSSWFDTSTYTFTPQKAGYWEITAAYDVYRNAESSLAIKKNNSIVAAAGSFNAVAQQVTKIIYLNGSTDSANVVNVGGAALSRSQYDSRSWFQARWIGAQPVTYLG